MMAQCSVHTHKRGHCTVPPRCEPGARRQRSLGRRGLPRHSTGGAARRKRVSGCSRQCLRLSLTGGRGLRLGRQRQQRRLRRDAVLSGSGNDGASRRSHRLHHNTAAVRSRLRVVARGELFTVRSVPRPL
jgi:hypothetical protein